MKYENCAPERLSYFFLVGISLILIPSLPILKKKHRMIEPLVEKRNRDWKLV
jgi:hypothetical protein